MKLVQPNSPRQILNENPWLAGFLVAHGFVRESSTTFTNGNASLRFEGTRLTAHPGNGRKAWIADLSDAESETIKVLLEQIVCTPPFLSESEIARQQTEQQRAQAALSEIAQSIRENPDTDSGQQLRRLLWSLYNQYHMVNLWRLTTTLDAHHARAAAEVFTGVLTGLLDDQALKHALLAAGEMERWDREHPANPAVQRLDEAEDIVRRLVGAIPPSHAHTELANLLTRFANAKEAITRRA